ncbi:MAG TPA: orotidine-5'-phosphate decarboxylase [Candidatus Saccharimonadales bacterium]|nr:orotidine-5'-phosphate decarboxylase [Candidatus Saccharimonadales bacterium]
MNFQQKLDKAVEKNNSLLCVGLDPVLEKLPQHLQKLGSPFFAFNKAIIDATHDVVCCYKPNSAFYEALGEKGIGELKKTCDYIKSQYPEIPIILDFKRGDIGNTNKAYAQFAFDYLDVDAVTVQPYLGKEGLSEFLNKKDKGIFILCKTSNPGSGEFQNLAFQGEHLYTIVSQHVAEEWNENNNCFLVVGATYPEELAEVRKIVGDMTLLVPGIGAQGGEVGPLMKAGLNAEKKGIIINSSREVLYAGDGEDFAQKARDKAHKLRDTINKYR